MSMSDFNAGIKYGVELTEEKHKKEIELLLKDKYRLDWLADINNKIGAVLLPSKCVKDNLSDLRAAIDAAMALPDKEVKQ